LIDLLKNVLLSWETIAVTVALVLYIQLVFYVARLRRKKPSKLFARKPKAPKAPKPPKTPKQGAEGEEGEEGVEEDEELQL
jgi:hypothetical protein